MVKSTNSKTNADISALESHLSSMNPAERNAFMEGNVILEAERVSSISSLNYPGTFTHQWGEPAGYDFGHFQSKFVLSINAITDEDMEMDIVGIDASMANALRRILIAEIPTIAIEKVFILDNSSVVPDEILSHRLGLIPIYADPTMFHYKRDDEEATDMNTLVFTLEVKCSRNVNNVNATEPSEKYINSSVLSGHLTWAPHGSQAERFAQEPPRPVMNNILLAKLRPGQSIHAELHCEKNIGREHAKWSPVATASYRLLPEIIITKPILDADAEKFATCFPPGVIQVVSDGKGHRIAKVANARKDTVSRECLRHKEFQDKVILARKRNHFIFSIESTGIMTPSTLFRESVRVLITKCTVLKEALSLVK